MWISRTALNEALHEVRRPLQALALAGAQEPADEPRIEQSLQLAASALERLDREINGGSVATVRTLVVARPLLEASLARWRPRAALAGARLELRWRAGEAVLDGDRCALAQALDNLIVNAIEHGGPRIAVEASRAGCSLRVVVADSGRRRPAGSARPRRGAVRRLTTRRRHGHGLRVVRRIVAAHGGSFELRRSERGGTALLELPLMTAGERQ